MCRAHPWLGNFRFACGLQHVEETGGFIELANSWGAMSEHRPDPQWHMVVDSWLHIPYPGWYQEYFMLHFNPAIHPEPFEGAYAAAMATRDGASQMSKEEIETAAEAAVQRLMRKPQKDEDLALLMCDAYAGRPFDLQQRVRSGSVPVLESSPNISLDEISARDPIATGELSADSAAIFAPRQRSLLEFVTDSGRSEPEYVRAARDPFGGGRHLLLPLFRTLQRRAARLLPLLQLAESGRGRGRRRGGSPADAAVDADKHESWCPALKANERLQQSSVKHASVQSPQTAQQDMQTGLKESQAQSEHHCGQRYSVTVEEAVVKARQMRGKWERELSRLTTGRERDESTPSSTAAAVEAQPAQASQAAPVSCLERDSASRSPLTDSTAERQTDILHLAASLGCKARLIKPDVYAAERGSRQALLRLLQHRPLAQHQNEDAGSLAKDLPPAWCSRIRVGEKPRINPMVGTILEMKRAQAMRRMWEDRAAASGAMPDAAGKGTSLAGDEHEAAAFSRAAQELRGRLGMGNKRRRSAWERRSLCSSADAGHNAQRLVAARLPDSMHDRTRVLVDAQALFASLDGQEPRSHKFRLLVLSKGPSSLLRTAEIEAAADDAVAAPVHSTGAAQQPPALQSAGTGLGSKETDSAARLGVLHGAGSAYFQPAPAPLPAVPDLIGLLGCGAPSQKEELLSNSPATNLKASATGRQESYALQAAGLAPSSSHAEQSDDAVSQAHRQAAAAGAAEHKEPVGLAWRGGQYMTIPMTTLYEFNVQTGQV